MKKTKILFILACAAILVTTFGTYAAWDQLSASETATLTIGNPVTVTMTGFDSFNVDREANQNDQSLGATYTSEAVINVSIPEELESTHEIVYEAEFRKGGQVLSQDKMFVECKEISSDKKTVSGTHTVRVTAIPKNKELIGQTLDASLTATLVEK